MGIYGIKYLIERGDGKDNVVGEMIQTKGNDDEFPTFRLEDGSVLGVHKSAVISEVEDLPLGGILLKEVE